MCKSGKMVHSPSHDIIADDFALHHVLTYSGVNSRAALETLAPGKRPESRNRYNQYL